MANKTIILAIAALILVALSAYAGYTIRKIEKENFRKAIAEANLRRLACRARSEERWNQFLERNGTAVPGQEGVYHLDAENQRVADEEHDKANADCQREYEDELQAARLKYSE